MNFRNPARAGALILGAVLIASIATIGAADSKHGPIPWLTSLSKAKNVAAKQKKPMLVDFYADWCPPCKEMAKSTWKDKQVVARAKKFVPVLVDIDKYPNQADSAKVSAVPTVVFDDSKGRELLRADGYRDAKAMLDLMAQAEKKTKR